jgi:hypothetical protein
VKIVELNLDGKGVYRTAAKRLGRKEGVGLGRRRRDKVRWHRATARQQVEQRRQQLDRSWGAESPVFPCAYEPLR